jgi:hypothetical protein
MSHVLEHLTDPVEALKAVKPLLAPGGHIAIAVPSVTHCGVRLRLLGGDWTYTETGILDWTHVKFFSRSGIGNVIEAAGYDVIVEAHEGALPLWRLRGFLPSRIVQGVNHLSAQWWPELFATQFVYLLRTRNTQVERTNRAAEDRAHARDARRAVL